MTELILYLLIGVGNYGHFQNGVGNPEGRDGKLELAFFILLWPVQTLFGVFVAASNFVSWLGYKFMG